MARNEFICWVEDAKQVSTRQRRIRRTQEGQRRPCCWPGCHHRERTEEKVPVVTGRDSDTRQGPKASDCEEESLDCRAPTCRPRAARRRSRWPTPAPHPRGDVQHRGAGRPARHASVITAVGGVSRNVVRLRYTGNLAASTGASTKELMWRTGHASARAALIERHATQDRVSEIADHLSTASKRAETRLVARPRTVPAASGPARPAIDLRPRWRLRRGEVRDWHRVAFVSTIERSEHLSVAGRLQPPDVGLGQAAGVVAVRHD